MAGKFDADKVSRNNFEGIKSYRQVPATVHAVQLNYPEGFSVTTPEGRASGQAGDYLVFGEDNSRRVWPRDAFEETHIAVKE